MNQNIDIYYNQYIKKLKRNDKLYIAKKILDEMETKKTAIVRNTPGKQEAIMKLKGIASNSNYKPTDDEWYKQ